MTALGRSGLETPSYIFSSVLAGIVLLCLIIEKVIEAVEHRIPHKRDGLKAAFKRMTSEVTLLGFMSLLLTLGEESISRICVDESVYHKDWIPLEALDVCDSCFSHMKRVSDDFNWKERCEEKHKHGESSPEAMDQEHGHHFMTRRTLLSHSENQPTCSKGEVQLISAKALHEVHTLIFLIAVTHVFVVVTMFLIATWRVQRLKRWNHEDDCEPSVLRVAGNTGVIHFYGRSTQIGTGRSVLQSLIDCLRTLRFPVHPNEDVNGLLPDPNPEQTNRKKDVEVLDGFIRHCKKEYGFLDEESQNGSITPAGPSGVNDSEVPRARGEVSLLTRCNTKICIPESFITDSQDNYLDTMDAFASREEWFAAFKKQFWGFISKDEFRNLTIRFLLEYRRERCTHFAKSDNLHYEDFLSSSLDDDIKTVVNIPLTGWIFAVGGYFVWAVANWSAWPVLAVLILLHVTVAIICAQLLTIVMLLTKDNEVRKSTPEAFWRKNPELLLPIIRNILFILTFVVATFLSVSWQYGARSCPLAGRVADDHWIHGAAAPLLIAVVALCFLHISFILMPLYSVVVHTYSLNFNKNLPCKLAKQAFYQLLEEMQRRGEEQTQTNTQEQSAFLTSVLYALVMYHSVYRWAGTHH